MKKSRIATLIVFFVLIPLTLIVVYIVKLCSPVGNT